jgi:glycosyltransferase involved in cell wall biosynthesis
MSFIMEDVTIIILTKNEELNLPDCLTSVEKFAKSIYVIDSGSTDNTEQIAKQFGAIYIYHKFDTYARQFNWALENLDIKTKWVFRLDADERLTTPLCNELKELMHQHAEDDINGVSMEASLFFMGREIKHGGPQKRKLMLFKTGTARIEDRKMDEHTILNCGHAVTCKEKFLHFDYKDMSFWIDKLNWYATREMQDYFDFINGKKADINANDKEIGFTRNMKFGVYYKFPKFIRCWLIFIYTYIFQLGFLDGKEGFIYHWTYHHFYRTLVDCKILEQEIKNNVNSRYD